MFKKNEYFYFCSVVSIVKRDLRINICLVISDCDLDLWFIVI